MLPDFSSICIKCLIWVAQSQISGQWLDSLSYLLRIFKVPWGSNFWFVIFCFALLDNAKPRCWTWQKSPATTAHCSCTLSILKRAVPKTILGASKLQWQVPTNIQSFWGIEELNFLLFISLLTLVIADDDASASPSKAEITRSIRILIWMLFAMAMAKPFKASEYQLRIRVMSFDIWVFQFVHWQNVKRP